MLKKQHLTPRERLSRAKERLGKSKGSVLFFVLAIMSVMIVMASAVYYAVSSARQEVEAKYASEQAYQSAISINDMVSDYIAKDPDNKFVSSALALANGDSIKTNVTDLAAGVGNVSVTITKISGGAGSAILSITTESVVNGETQVVTSVGELTESSEADEPASLSRFFTSTGYVPNDTLYGSATINSELYLDSEYTEMGGQANAANGTHIRADVISSGTIRFNRVFINDDPAGLKPINITIGNDCYLTTSGNSTDLCGGTMRVGGSVLQLAACYPFENNTNVYIQGDYYSGAGMDKTDGQRLFVNGNFVISDFFSYKGDIYVNGDVFLDKDYNQGTSIHALHVGGKVYVDKNGNLANQLVTLHSAGITDDQIVQSEVPIDFDLSADESNNKLTVYEEQETIESIINGNGGVHGYTYIWPSNSSDVNACESMETVTKTIKDTLGNAKYVNWDLDKLFHIGQNPANPYIDTTEIVFPFKNDGGEYPYSVTLSAKNTDKYIIQDIDVQRGYSGHALIFDTSDGSGGYKDIYVMLKPNVKYTKDPRTIEYPKFTFNTVTEERAFTCPGKNDDGSNCDGTALDYSGGRVEKSEQYLTCDNCGERYDCTNAQQYQDGQTWASWMNIGAPYNTDTFECTSCGEPITQFTVHYTAYPAKNVFTCGKCGNVIEQDASVQWIDGTKDGAWLKDNVDIFKTQVNSWVETTKDTPDEELNGFIFGDTVPDQGGTTPNNSTPPFHVLVKGQGSVIFVIPNGVTFIARNQSYFGNMAFYKELTGEDFENAEKNGYKSSNDGIANLKALETDSSRYDPAKGMFTQTMIDKYNDKGTGDSKDLYIHNNVFLVSVEKNVSIDFETSEMIFAGMVYAPYMQFQSQADNASNKALFGGLVVSNYSIEGTTLYDYGAPYDYYDRLIPEKNADGSDLTEEQKEAEREKYLANLMGQTGSNQFLPEGGSGQIGRAWNRFGYN